MLLCFSPKNQMNCVSYYGHLLPLKVVLRQLGMSHILLALSFFPASSPPWSGDWWHGGICGSGGTNSNYQHKVIPYLLWVSQQH